MEPGLQGAVEGATDGAKRAWRRKNQSEESKEKERARNRRAQVGLVTCSRRLCVLSLQLGSQLPAGHWQVGALLRFDWLTSRPGQGRRLARV